MNTSAPPLTTLSYSGIYKRLTRGEACFKDTLFRLLDHIENPSDKHSLSEAFWSLECEWLNGNQNPTEEQYKEAYRHMQRGFEKLSFMLRNIKSKNIFTEGLADTLYLYSKTQTFFTPSDEYSKVAGEEVAVRKCEVTCDPRNRRTNHDPFVNEEERVVYRGQKEYDPTYIWGQLVGWHKQTVDKPNASLSADRRGTLCFPDLESFDYHIISEKRRRPFLKKKKNEDYNYNMDECSIGEEEKTKNSQGRKRKRNGRPPKENGGSKTKANSKEKPKEDGFIYPWKKHPEREEFLLSWKNNFSKQWDVLKKWNFRNTKKMYGSLQFESLVKNGLSFEEDRLTYFREVVDELLQFRRQSQPPIQIHESSL